MLQNGRGVADPMSTPHMEVSIQIEYMYTSQNF